MPFDDPIRKEAVKFSDLRHLRVALLPVQTRPLALMVSG
jgi:hypothetical protein